MVDFGLRYFTIPTRVGIDVAFFFNCRVDAPLDCGGVCF